MVLLYRDRLHIRIAEVYTILIGRRKSANVPTKHLGVLMRKGKVALTSIASILWIIGFFVSPSHGKLIVGLSSVNVAFLPVYVTEDRGFFKDEGLDVLLVLFNAGATNLQALVGGDIQIMGSAFVETIGGRGA